MDFLGALFPILLMIPIFYFLIIRPNQLKQKKHQNMLNGLTKADEVVTRGGLHGKVVGVDKDIVVLTIAENVKIEVSRGAIEFKKKAGELIEGE